MAAVRHAGPRRVLFIDTVASHPYSELTLSRRAMGGTEATVVRVAGALARFRPVTVAQCARRAWERGADGVDYVPFDPKRMLPRMHDVGSVVVVRAGKLLKRVSRCYPEAQRYLWLHCFPGRRRRRLASWAARYGTTVVGVSQWHVDEMRSFFRLHDPMGAMRCRFETVHNPVAEGLEPVPFSTDRDKLLFLSSPHKGLDQVLEAFRYCRSRIPSLQLHICNPGYLQRPMEGDLDGVHVLGKLAHQDVVHELRTALCLFYPQSRFSETFGLVFAEANAVGTPVLAHPRGAAAEVVSSADQLVDATDHGAVYETVRRWRKARPIIRGKSDFQLPLVAARWEELFSGPARQTKPACHVSPARPTSQAS